MNYKEELSEMMRKRGSATHNNPESIKKFNESVSSDEFRNKASNSASSFFKNSDKETIDARNAKISEKHNTPEMRKLKSENSKAATEIRLATGIFNSDSSRCEFDKKEENFNIEVTDIKSGTIKVYNNAREAANAIKKPSEDLLRWEAKVRVVCAGISNELKGKKIRYIDKV